MSQTKTKYRLVLSHPQWVSETQTKWQESPDFSEALAHAASMGIEARVESRDDPSVEGIKWAHYNSGKDFVLEGSLTISVKRRFILQDSLSPEHIEDTKKNLLPKITEKLVDAARKIGDSISEQDE